MYSNEYTFIRANKADNHGTFFQRAATDDGGEWYGQGMFKETRHKLTLIFDTTISRPRIETAMNKVHSDTLYVKWYDCLGNRQDWFRVGFSDTTINKEIFASDLLTGLVKIPRTGLKNLKLSLYAYGTRVKLSDFDVANNINVISIFVNPGRIHLVNKSKEVLRKTKNGFVTTGMFISGKRVSFFKQK